jgi:hypothetical protein
MLVPINTNHKVPTTGTTDWDSDFAVRAVSEYRSTGIATMDTIKDTVRRLQSRQAATYSGSGLGSEPWTAAGRITVQCVNETFTVVCEIGVTNDPCEPVASGARALTVRCAGPT